MFSSSLSCCCLTSSSSLFPSHPLKQPHHFSLQGVAKLCFCFCFEIRNLSFRTETVTQLDIFVTLTDVENSKVTHIINVWLIVDLAASRVSHRLSLSEPTSDSTISPSSSSFVIPSPLFLLLFLLSSLSMTSVKRTSFPESFRSTRAKRRASRRPAMSTVSTSARGEAVCLTADWSATGREVSWWQTRWSSWQQGRATLTRTLPRRC